MTDKKICYSQSQIIKVLKELKGGFNIKAICRESSISEVNSYKWKINTVALKGLVLNGLKS